jgi:hypothetical protein
MVSPRGPYRRKIPPSDAIKYMQPEISVMVRHDEARYIEQSGRCVKCGHLEVLHGSDEAEANPTNECKLPDCQCYRGWFV